MSSNTTAEITAPPPPPVETLVQGGCMINLTRIMGPGAWRLLQETLNGLCQQPATLAKELTQHINAQEARQAEQQRIVDMFQLQWSKHSAQGDIAYEVTVPLERAAGAPDSWPASLRVSIVFGAETLRLEFRETVTSPQGLTAGEQDRLQQAMLRAAIAPINNVLGITVYRKLAERLQAVRQGQRVECRIQQRVSAMQVQQKIQPFAGQMAVKVNAVSRFGNR